MHAVVLAMSYGSLMAIPYVLKSGEHKLNITNSILSALLFIVIDRVIASAMRIPDKRMRAISAALGLVFSASLILGANITLYGSAYLNLWRTYVKILLFQPLMFAVVMLGIANYGRLAELVEGLKWERGAARLLRSKKAWFYWMILMVAWIPALLSAYPGIYAYDSIFQVKWFLDDTINNQHPFLHTVWLGGSVKLGQLLFHSNELGLLFYTVSQMMLLAAILAYSIRWLYGKLPYIGIAVATALLVILPYHALLSISATKDTIFAGLFLMVLLKTYDMVISPELFLNSKKRCIEYVVFVILMMLFRNNGVYVFLFMLPFLFGAYRRYWKKLACIGGVCLIFWIFWSGVCLRLFHVYKIGIKEMLSVPMNQMVRSLVLEEEEDRLSEGEKEYIKDCFPDYDRYSPTIADNVKNTARMDIIEADKPKFFRMWAEVGKKCFNSYIDAWLVMSCGNWYVDMQYPIPEAWHPYLMYNNYTVEDGYGDDYAWVERTSFLPILSKGYSAIAYRTIHQHLPVLSLLMNPGLAFWVVAFEIAYCLYKKRMQMVVPLMLCVGLWGTIMLGPVVLLRYTYPLMISMPAMIAMGIMGCRGTIEA